MARRNTNTKRRKEIMATRSAADELRDLITILDEDECTEVIEKIHKALEDDPRLGKIRDGYIVTT